MADLFDIAIARKLSGGGGGGGSSDFSTATVTFTVVNGGEDERVPAIGPLCENDEYFVGITDGGPSVNGDTLQIPLYRGKCGWAPNLEVCPELDIANFSSTGGVTIDSENWSFTITGDGTLNYTNA